MTVARGIAHAERTPAQQRAGGSRLFGIQSWVALPSDHEEIAPAFLHRDRAELPVIEDAGARVRLIAGDRFGPGQLLVLRPGDALEVRARADARFMLLGGEPMDGPRSIWWNFVSTRKERIEVAKADWKADRFAAVPGEHEFSPLAER